MEFADRRFKQKVFMATCRPGDEEMRQRIKKHQKARGSDWQTLEVVTALSEAVTFHSGRVDVILIDCMTLCGISSLHEYRALYLIIIPAYARGSFTIAIHFLDYFRPKGGTAKEFFANNSSIANLGWLLAPVALSLLLGFRGLLLNDVFIGIVSLVTLYYKKRLSRGYYR